MKWRSPLLLSILVAGTFSCSKNREIKFTDEIVLSNDLIGKWSIVSFTDSGIDKTAQLSSLSLQFNSSGDFHIFNNDSIVDGDWTILPQIGLDLLKVTVSNSKTPYMEFQASWYVYNQTTSTINLSNSSPSRSQVLQLKRI